MAINTITWEYSHGNVPAVGFKIYRDDVLVATLNDVTVTQYIDDVTVYVGGAVHGDDLVVIYRIVPFDADGNDGQEYAYKTSMFSNTYQNMLSGNTPLNEVVVTSDAWSTGTGYTLFTDEESVSFPKSDNDIGAWNITSIIKLEEPAEILAWGWQYGYNISLVSDAVVELFGFDNEDESDIVLLDTQQYENSSSNYSYKEFVLDLPVTYKNYKIVMQGTSRSRNSSTYIPYNFYGVNHWRLLNK